MNTETKPTETVKNYSDEQMEILRTESPFDWSRAKELAIDFGKSPQSIVSKVKSMELPYTVKPAPRKKAIQDTKDELVATIEKRLDRKLDGLAKANREALLSLINGLDHKIPKPTVIVPELGASD